MAYDNEEETPELPWYDVKEGNPRFREMKSLEWIQYVGSTYLLFNYCPFKVLVHFQGYLYPSLKVTGIEIILRDLALKGQNKIR